jgi:hypothetical protein
MEPTKRRRTKMKIKSTVRAGGLASATSGS